MVLLLVWAARSEGIFNTLLDFASSKPITIAVSPVMSEIDHPMSETDTSATADWTLAPPGCRELSAKLARFPRVRLGYLPTPLASMDRLSEALGGPRIWIKRDDCTGLATGGNKTRKLEYLLAEAKAQNATSVITQGAVQSNHARQTAAAATRMGFACHLLLENRTESADPIYLEGGNVLLDRLFGARITYVNGGADMSAEMEALADRLAGAGERCYVIPGGGSNPTGALGYVNCARELVEQAAAIDLRIDAIVHATGSSGTQAGIVVGLAAMQSDIDLLGIGVRAPKEKQEAMVHDLAVRTAKHLGTDADIPERRVQADCDFVGPGYGLPTAGMVHAIEKLAQLEGILLDPVYSGKGMDGLITRVREGRFDNARNIVFLHTGGAAALFGYPQIFPDTGHTHGKENA